MLLLALAPLALLAASIVPTSSDGNWWVVLASSPDPDYDGRVHPEVNRARAAALRCGVRADPDFSAKWVGLKPGFYVQMAGGFRTRAQAERVLAQVKRCVPGAYLHAGAYAGD